MNYKTKFRKLSKNVSSSAQKYPREYFVAIFFGIVFFILIGKTFSYTIIDHDFYKELADKQQITKLDKPISRGTIYAKGNDQGPGGVLATSVELNDLAIDPNVAYDGSGPLEGQQGDKEKLAKFLTDIAYEELCVTKGIKKCYLNLLSYTDKEVIDNFSYEEQAIKSILEEEITKRVNKKKITSVMLNDNVTEFTKKDIIDTRLPGLEVYENYLYGNPEAIQDRRKTADTIAEILGGDPQVYYDKLESRDVRYVPILNRISIASSDKINERIKEERTAYYRNILEYQDLIYPFIILSPRDQRIYPEGEIGAQVVGFLNNEGQGNYGLEEEFHEELQGDDEAIYVHKDTRGRVIDTMGQSLDFDSGRGVDVHTTIDRSVQKTVQETLAWGVEEFNANKGSVIVMDPNTGDIIAMANYPSYDPNNSGEVYKWEKVDYAEYTNPETDFRGREVYVVDLLEGKKFYVNGEEVYLRPAEREEYSDRSLEKYIYSNEFGPSVYKNDVISALYEPGSIMKAMTVAIGIDSGEIKADELYNDVGILHIGSDTIENESDVCSGYHTFAHALDYSCNVGMVRISQRIGKALMYHYFEKFGFDKKTDISLQGEANPRLDPWQSWADARLYTSSYGLGINVSLMQMAVAYSAIANGGLYVKPKIIDYIEYPDGRKTIYKPIVSHRVIKESTSDQMRLLLKHGVDYGVAKPGAVPGYSISGKTGTSQINYKGRYEGLKWDPVKIGTTNASYAGFAPTQSPKFVMIVKLERPRTSNYGSQTSAIIFQKIAKELMSYYGIPKETLADN